MEHVSFMETASAVFVPRSKRWWTSNRRRQSGYHFRAFRQNYSHFRLTFSNPFKSLPRRFHYSYFCPEELGSDKTLYLVKSCFFLIFLGRFRLSWYDLSFCSARQCRFFLSKNYQKRTLISFPHHVFALCRDPFGRPRSCVAIRPFCRTVTWLI